MSEKDRQKMLANLTRHSRRFHERLFKPAFVTPSTFQLMAFRMARTSIHQMLGDDNRDYTWYRDHGWFDSDYYYPTKLGPLKKTAGAAFDWMAGRMFQQRNG